MSCALGASLGVKTMLRLNWCLDFRFGLLHRTGPLQRKQRKAEVSYTVKSKAPCVTLYRQMTVRELAKLLGKSQDELSVCFEYLGIPDQAPDDAIGDDVLIAVTKLSGFRYRFGLRETARESDQKSLIDPSRDAVRRPPPEINLLIRRPPIVTVMGHVDHGKTTLLDAIRKSRIASEEYGGITQQIGAFLVTLADGRKITFIDTPGHAAFVSMRERGVKVTDIVVLVVAADDGFMPQTAECMYHIKKEKVPFVVAINKVDKSNADVPRTLHSLLSNGVQIDEMGGDILSAQLSALKAENIDRLLETILMLADEINIAGDPTGLPEGLVMESKIDKVNGPTATVIVQRGQLKAGQNLVAGLSRARVRKLLSDTGLEQKCAGLSEPVQVVGWKTVPHAGSEFVAVEDEGRAKRVIHYREQLARDERVNEASLLVEKQREVERAQYRALLEQKRKAGRVFFRDRSGPAHIEINKEVPVMPIILKADTDGAVETLLSIVDSYQSPELVSLEVVNFGIGDVSTTDVENSTTFQAIIYGFNVGLSAGLPERTVTDTGLIRLYRVIYHLLDDLKKEIDRRVLPVDKERIVGKALVKQVFSVKEKRRKISIAGCTCQEGELTNADLYKLVRGGAVIHTGMLSSLKHLKDDVKIVAKGTDCGLTLRDCETEFQPGDEIICFRLVPEKPRVAWSRSF